MQGLDIISPLRDWEHSFPVDDWVVDDVHVWPLLRIAVGFRMLVQDWNRAGASTLRVAVAETLDVGRTAIAWARDYAHTVTRVEPADVLILSDPTCREWLSGSWRDRYFDPIIDVLSAQSCSSLVLEYCPRGIPYRLPRYRPSLLIRPAVFRARVLARLRNRARRAVPRLEGYPAFVESVARERPGVSVPALAWVQTQVCEVASLADYFGVILDRARPSLVFCVSYYSVVGMALCLAAARRSITVVDVQHGVMQGNPAYDGWTRFPRAGYALLPNVFWCWSDGDARLISAWPGSARARHRPLVGGHPWEAFWEHPPDAVAQRYERDLGAIRGQSLNVLVALSWSSGLSESLLDVIRNSPDEWRWWIRVHPSMGAARGRIERACHAAGAGRVHVALPTDLPLPLLLRRADVLLTHNSTAIKEAAVARLASVAMDTRALEIFPREVAAGWLCHAEGRAAIVAALEQQVRVRNSLVPPQRHPSYQRMAEALGGLTALRA